MPTYTVKVFNAEQDAIKQAQVSLTSKVTLSKAKEETVYYANYVSELGIYEFDAIPSGRYLLEVTKKGYKTEKVYVAINELGFDQRVFLEKLKDESRKFIISKNVKLPFIRKEIIAIRNSYKVVPKQTKTGLSKEGAFIKQKIDRNLRSKIDVFEEAKGKSGLFVDIDQFKSKGNEEIVKELLKVNEINTIDRVLIDHLGNKLTVLNLLFIKFFDEVTLAEQKEFINSKVIRLIEKTPYEHNTYIIQYLESSQKDIFKYATEILEMGLLEVAEPILDVDKERTAINPPDLLYQEQWYLPLVKVSDAWDRLKSKDPNLTFGSADVILCIYDDGIQSATVGGITNAVLADFSGNVKGGSLSAIVQNNRKMYGFYDFRPGSVGAFQLMTPDNNTPEIDVNTGLPGSHGLGCAGVATASAGGSEGLIGNQGLVGAAPNVRLLGTTWGGATTNFVDNHAMAWMGGVEVLWWADGLNYSGGGLLGAQTFPAKFNTPQNLGPGASIISVSSTWPSAVPANGATDLMVHNVTSFGRNRRGTAIFFAAANNDRVNTADVVIAQHEKVFTVAASSLDSNGEEVRSSYSCWGTGPLNGIDFCAPTHYFYVNTPPAIFGTVPPYNSGVEHQPPTNYGVISAFRQGTGNYPIVNTSQTTITGQPNATTLTIAVGGPGFAIGNALLINPGQPNAEGARITNVVGGTTITVSHALKGVYVGGEPVIAGQADATDTFGGTSSATPLTAGIAALVLSANPNLTFLELRNVLQITAEPIDFRLETVNGTNMGWRTQAVGGVNIIDGNALMVVNAIAPANTNVNNVVGYPARATSIRVNSVANFTVGQVILFGAETTLALTGAVAAGALNVANVANFQPNMDVIVGAGPSAVIRTTSAIGAGSIRVNNTKGFRVNQRITIGVVGVNAEIRTIAAIVNSTQINLNGGVLVNVHNKYEPVVLTNTETHRITPGVIVAGTLNLVGNLANAHTVGIGNPRVWVRSTNCEIRRIKAIDTANNILTIDPLVNPQPHNTPVTGGLSPLYSLSLGYGRVNADLAVQAALNYNHSLRDLIIRNSLIDNGLTSTDVNALIDSPDIWSRNAGPPAPPIAAPHIPAAYGIHGNTVHQKPRRGGDRWIYMRVGNQGTNTSFDYSMHAYLSMVDKELDQPITCANYGNGPTQPSPNPASPIVAPVTYTFGLGYPGTMLIGTRRSPVSTPVVPAVRLPQIAGGADQTFQVRWLQANVPTLPLTFASVILTNPVNAGNTTIQVSDSRGFRTGQTILVGLPATANQFQATVQSVADRVLTLSAPAPAIGAAIPTGVQVMRLDNTHATQVNTAIAAPAASVEVADATHFMPGQYVLVGPPGNNTSEIVQIGSITYNNAGNDVLNLITSLTNPRGLGDAVTRVEGKLSTFILAEVTPHDGLLAGDTPYDNNNMSCKEVFLGHKLSFLDNSNARLQKDVQVDSSGTAVTVQFRLRVEDPENFTTEQIQFTAYRLGTNNQMETVTFVYNLAGANWVKTGGAWLTINDPVVNIGGGLAAGVLGDVWFTGSFTVTNAHQDVRLCLSVPDAIPTTFRTIETCKIAVNSVAAPTGSSSSIANSSGQPKIGGTQRMHVFADLTNMTQTATQAFGPIDTNRFRLTSLFSTPAAAGASVMAYAVLDGLVFVQENPTNNTINLIIQPLRQADINYTKVKYFIYRGLRKADFVDGGNPANVRATTNNAKANFLDNLHKTNQTLNPGSTLTLAALNWDNKPVEEYLDNYFFNAGTDSQLPVVGRGMELGRFHNISGADEFGFEIVLAEGEYTLTIADAQASSKIVDVSSIADANEKQAKREEILNYVDPAAYFGMHFYSKLFYPTIPDPDPNVINTQTYTGADIYTNVVSKFYTKNTLYIDIRNEHGYSFNYDGTYTISDATIDNGNALRVGAAPSSSGNPLIPQKYHHQDWPILIKDNQGAPLQSTLDTSSVYMNLPWNVHNPHPQVYVERGFLLTASNQNRFVSHSKLLDNESIVLINEGTSTITVNAVLTAAITANDFISILGNSFLGANRVYRVLNVAANAGNAAHTDLQVEAGTIPAGAQAAARKGSIAFRKWTKDVGFSYPVQPNGVAGQRVNVAGVIKLRYYRRLNPNVRPITAINQGANQMTVAGDVSAMLSAGDYFIVRGATPVGNNHNDGEYQVSNAAGSVTVVGGNTQITVTTAIPAAGVSGEVYLSAQKKVKTAHYHDNIFGSLNALNRKIPISSMTVVSPTQTTITVKGDFLATANLNTTLSILEANIPGNNLNGLNIVNRVLNAGNTEITVQHAAAALTMDTTGYIQLIYSVWKSTAPTRWLSGFDKRFIDAKNTPANAAGTPQVGFSYVGQTGIALETDGVIFYATPIDFFEAPKKGRVPNSISINGGTSTEDSFWKAMQNQNQRLKLHMTLLKIGATEVPVYDFVDYPGDAEDDAMKENFFALCLTKTEITQLTHAANQNLVGGHDQYLVLRKEVSTTDDNGAAYKRYEVRVNGWAKVGSNVVEREIAPAAPIYVYAPGENALVFASQNYPNLGVLLSEANTKYEEELRLRTDALTIYNASGGINTMVNAFVSNLNSISNNYGLIKTTVQNAADQLWTLASNPVAVQDDRWSYWARLHMRVAVRNHPYLKNQRSRMFDMLTELQDRSRGISSISFLAANAGDKKILLIAFDPFGLDKTIHEDYNIQKSSPGVASALSLHGQTLSKGGVNGYIQVVVFPVRYRTFQRDDLETMVLPFLTGANQIDMICTLHDNRNGRYDIERFASRKRGVNHTDNDNKKGSIATRYYKARPDASLSPPYRLIRYAESSRPKFLKTTLPIANMIPGSLGNNLVIYNQSYATDNPAHTQGLAATGSGTANVPDPNAASNPTVGSSGDFLFNEAFYRIASIREDVNATTKTGHISLERIQGPNDDFDLVKTQSVQTRLKSLIEDALAGL